MRKGFRLAAVLLFACLVSVSSFADGIFLSNYNASVVFQDVLGGYGHPMGIAFDGVHYWAVTGGYSYASAEYDSHGNFIAQFSPGLDFRSVFSDGSGQIFARQFNDPTIYQQTSPGVYSSFLTLNGGSLDSQSNVVLNSAGTMYISQQGGTVQEWNLSGNYLGSVSLIGYVDNGYPSDRGIASAAGYFLTYAGSGQLQAWDASGHLVGTTTLNLAGTSFDSYFSFSYANGMVWVDDQSGGMWRGYDVGLSTVPEPGTLVMLGTGVLGLAGAIRRKLV